MLIIEGPELGIRPPSYFLAGFVVECGETIVDPEGSQVFFIPIVKKS